jgi:hypothetical protein
MEQLVVAGVLAHVLARIDAQLAKAVRALKTSRHRVDRAARRMA